MILHLGYRADLSRASPYERFGSRLVELDQYSVIVGFCSSQKHKEHISTLTAAGGRIILERQRFADSLLCKEMLGVRIMRHCGLQIADFRFKISNCKFKIEERSDASQ